MNNKDIHLSKALSWLLRHAAVKEGITISPKGYIDVKTILNHRSFSKYTLEDIEGVVVNNDKQRFTLRTNPITHCLEIKAHQGHTLGGITDDELRPVTEPIYKIVVHGTYMRCWPRIKTEGLSRMKRRHIHLAKALYGDLDEAVSRPRWDAEVLVYLDLHQLLADKIPFYEAPNGVLLSPGNSRGYILPKYFAKIIKVQTVIPVMETVAVAAEAAAAAAAEAADGAQPASESPQRRRRPRNHHAHNIQQQNQNVRKKVLVTGFPAYTQQSEIARVLAQFGSLTVDTCKNRLAVVEFSAEEQASAALRASGRLVVYGECITIRRYTNHRHVKDVIRSNRRVKSEADEELISPKDIELEGDFYAQVEQISRAIRLTREQVTALSALYADVQRVLQAAYPGAACVPFGSITTGLGVRSSDADCFVQLPPRFLQPGYDVSFVHRARRALAAHERFAELVPIPGANTPILKFLHRPTGTRCDLSCKTPLGALNSRLLAYLLRRDPRLPPAALTLKYWARVQRLTGSGRLSNYALVLLLVFYLQAGAALLPPVRRLQAAAPPQLVDHWNAAFHPEPPPPPPPAPALPDLLAGFFRFYSEFDFDSLVVCPFLGEALPKTAFENEGTPETLPLYGAALRARRAPPLRHASPLCVQDPFEHSHNVAAGVSPRLAEQLRAALRAAAAAAAGPARELLRGVLAPAPRVPRPARALRLRVPARLLAAPDWRPRARAAMLDEVLGELLGLRPEPAPPSDDPDAPDSDDVERYEMEVCVPLWNRRKFANPRAFSAAMLRAREADVSARLHAVPELRLPEPQRLQLELAFSEAPRALTVTVESELPPDLLSGLAKFLHLLEQSWLPILMQSEPPAPAPAPPAMSSAAQLISSLSVSSPDSPAPPPAAPPSASPVEHLTESTTTLPTESVAEQPTETAIASITESAVAPATESTAAPVTESAAASGNVSAVAPPDYSAVASSIESAITPVTESAVASLTESAVVSTSECAGAPALPAAAI